MVDTGGVRRLFDDGSSHLERYASRLNAVEINSTFDRSHRRTTYERWAANVPDAFRFAVKLPKTITHERRLEGCADLLARFNEETGGLGEKRGPVLIQLPPSLRFDDNVARRFLIETRAAIEAALVLEPRHPSWFSSEVDALLASEQVARVAADPGVVPNAARPGGWRDLGYFRLHGSPRTYWSDYPAEAIDRHEAMVRDLLAARREVWTIFDNTAAGHAPANALSLTTALASRR